MLMAVTGLVLALFLYAHMAGNLRSAMLFTAAKVSHLGLLPQGQPERDSRVLDMVAAQDAAGFGGCANSGECAAVCPKGIPLILIGRLNSDYRHARR
jgi:succinate dehydrogenase / fumarate reductase iron-sulfur subunit